MLKDVVQNRKHNTVAFDFVYGLLWNVQQNDDNRKLSSDVKLGGLEIGIENAKVCLQLGVDEVLSTFIVAPPDATFVHIWVF